MHFSLLSSLQTEESGNEIESSATVATATRCGAGSGITNTSSTGTRTTTMGTGDLVETHTAALGTTDQITSPARGRTSSTAVTETTEATGIITTGNCSSSQGGWQGFAAVHAATLDKLPQNR